MIDDVLSGREMWSIAQGDCRSVLNAMPPESVHMCVTSIPYWALRAYGTEPQIWGATDPTCQHEWHPTRTKRGNGSGGQVHEGNEWAANFGRSDYTEYTDRATYSDVCGNCGAWRGELGLEPDIDSYVAHIVEVFRAVWRVLRRDGVMFVNCGDTYASGWACERRNIIGQRSAGENRGNRLAGGLKEKDLCMIPARVALALQADGWWLRSEITWCKKAPMPESCQDRPTSATEKIFLLSKSERYYYDATAVAEPSVRPGEVMSLGGAKGRGQVLLPEYPNYRGGYSQLGRDVTTEATRNLRNYWVLGPEPMRDEHYAAYPTEIPKRAILAGSSEKGVCPDCGAPWRRVVEKVTHSLPVQERHGRVGHNGNAPQQSGYFWKPPEVKGHSWRPSCKHDLPPVPAVVLDPFVGSGTSVIVALRHGRRGIGIDLKPEYVQLARRRIEGDPLANNMRMSLEEVAG